MVASPWLLMFLVGLALGACGGDLADDVTPASSTSVASTEPPTTVPSSTTSTTQTTTTTTLAPALAELPRVAEEVVASDDGIFLVLHGDEAPIGQLWDQPTALAFMVGEDLVVAQRSAESDVYPWRTEGPIVAFDPTGTRSLPMGDEQLTLFDAGVVAGRPVALASSTIEGGPDTRDVRLVLLDLITGERSDLGSVGGWESGVAQARLAADRVALVSGGEGRQGIRVLSMDGTELWALPPGPEASTALSVREDQLIVLEPGFVEPNFTPTITLDRYALEDGTQLGTTTVTLQLGDDVRIDGGFCFTAEWMGEGLVCDQTYGGPLLIDVFSGTVANFGGFESGVLTIPRRHAR